MSFTVESFLGKVSAYILESSKGDTSNYCIVLPNRRAALFLEKKLKEQISSPIWSPDIFSIEDLIWKLSGLKKADLAEQLFILYEVYRDTQKEKPESFDEFCKWAPTLLGDFNETDAHLADTASLFGNLADIRTIENWSLNEPVLTDFQKQYIHFWSSIGTWYNGFKTKMTAKGLAYAGLASRLVSENITTLIDDQNWKKIIFAGFNAFTPAEEKLITSLTATGSADMLWDSDRYYMEDKAQEAGKFLRQNIKRFKKTLSSDHIHFQHMEDRLSTEAKSITITAVARLVSQAKAASWFLEQLPEVDRYSEKNAVVLADETLLFPMLHSLPGNGKVNITMGYPLRNTPAGSLLHALFLLQENAERFKVYSRDKEIMFYHTDLARIFRHPWFHLICGNNILPQILNKYLANSNSVFCSATTLKREATKNGHSFDLGSVFLTKWSDTTEAIDHLRELIVRLRSEMSNVEDKFEMDLEFLFQLDQLLTRTQTLQQQYGVATELKSFRALIEQQVASSTLPFFGEPLAGLQIMGLLETRTLDFDNVLLLAANEGILPAAKNAPTFIIYELRKAFHLPTFSDRDSVAAYHFYRLLQRAKNIFITYNTDTDLFGSKEKSRFVTQLVHELPSINKNIKLVQTVFDAGLKAGDTQARKISIPKTEEVVERLHELALKGFSPSSLNVFRACALQFFFRYVAGLREKKEVEETVDADTMGTLIHKALEELYLPFLGKALTPEFYTNALLQTEDQCANAFGKIFKGEESNSGKNLLAKRIAVQYITAFLNKESSDARIHQIIPEALEVELSTQLTISGSQVRLYGKADRVETYGGVTRIIDYKTGIAKSGELKYADAQSLLNKPELAKSFQLLMYAWLYRKNNPSQNFIRSGIISFRKLNEGVMYVSPDGKGTLCNADLDEFEKVFQTLFEDLFTTENKFDQTADLKICKLCTFNSLCGRME